MLEARSDRVRQRDEILLDIDSTDFPTHGQQQLSFFNGAYGQHTHEQNFSMYVGCPTDHPNWHR
jgi:hypothetical protein